MKTFNKLIVGLSIFSMLLASCNDFEDINKDSGAVNEENVKTTYLLNKSIIEAQQNPEMGERLFVYQWKSAARFERSNRLATGYNYDIAFNNEYFSNRYGVAWLNNVNKAIQLAEKRLEGNNPLPYEHNVLQMARIWRAYIVSELADCFGSIPPVNKFDRVIEYQSVEAIYEFILEELADAVSQLDVKADMSQVAAEGTDAFYNGDVSKWIKYGNSLRLRYAMRLSQVAPQKAQQAFEAAANENLITELSETAQVQERDGWDALAGVMSRSWNPQPLSVTLNNLMIGLGGIEFQVPEEIKENVNLQDARQYLGLRLENHLSTKTNDPAAGYFFDGLPAKIDPRATKLFHIPGYDDGVVYSSYVGMPEEKAELIDPENTKNILLELDVNYTWNTWVYGKWENLSTLSAGLVGTTSTYPSLSKQYRMSTNKRVWFAPWETYFLLAEAAEYGWNVPGTAQSNYENGIAASFEYHGIIEFVDDYLVSTEYNRIGTSVSFTHTAEAQPYTVAYKDGYTGKELTKLYEYPKNSIYREGNYNNDRLTKIITQKYLAQVPWLPLEAWSDHRRLGLPFFENQAVEIDYTPSNNELPLTTKNYHECRWEFYQERFRYPTDIQINSKENYETAVKLLGGPDLISTPLWWANR